MEEGGLELSYETSDEASLAAEAGQNFDGKLAAREKVEGLVEVADFAIFGNQLGAGDPVEIEAGDGGKLLGERCEPGGVVAAEAAAEAGRLWTGKSAARRTRMGREIGRDDPAVVVRGSQRMGN